MKDPCCSKNTWMCLSINRCVTVKMRCCQARLWYIAILRNKRAIAQLTHTTPACHGQSVYPSVFCQPQWTVCKKQECTSDCLPVHCRGNTPFIHTYWHFGTLSAWSLNWVFLTRQQPDLGERRSQQSCCPQKLCDYNTLNYIYKVLYGMEQCCILNPVFIVVPNNQVCWMALTHKHGINVLVGTGDRTASTSPLPGCNFVNRGKLKCFLGLYVVSFSTVSPQSSQSLHFLLYIFFPNVVESLSG